jgi:hypothetical protein
MNVFLRAVKALKKKRGRQRDRQKERTTRYARVRRMVDGEGTRFTQLALDNQTFQNESTALCRVLQAPSAADIFGGCAASPSMDESL